MSVESKCVTKLLYPTVIFMRNKKALMRRELGKHFYRKEFWIFVQYSKGSHIEYHQANSTLIVIGQFGKKKHHKRSNALICFSDVIKLRQWIFSRKTVSFTDWYFAGSWETIRITNHPAPVIDATILRSRDTIHYRMPLSIHYRYIIDTLSNTRHDRIPGILPGVLGPGSIVKTAILPGKGESLDFNRVRFRHCQNIIMKPVPGIIVETTILPGIYKSFGFKRIFPASPNVY